MNRKAQTSMVGAIIMVAIVAIVGAILLTASAQNLEVVRNTHAIANESTVSTNGTTGIIDTDCQVWTDIVVYNGTDDIIITSGNYSVTNNFVSNSALTVRFNVTTEPIYQGQPWNVSYTCEPYGYADGGGRAVAGLIIIFMALAVAVVILVPTLKSKILGR